MAKKLIVLAMAVAALVAVAIPAAASATELRMTNSSGALVPTGTAITGVANNSTLRLVTKETTLGELECESIMLNGKVTVNNGTKVEGEGTAGSTTANCHFQPSNKVAEVTAIKLTNLKSETTGVGSFEAEYEAIIPGGAPCHFVTEGPGEFTFTSGSDTIEVAPTAVESAACGESTLVGKVKLETAAGGAIVGV